MLWLLAATILTASPSDAVATAEPRAPLREIGHVRAKTDFCATFERRFNGVVRPALAGDERIGAIGFTLGTIESHLDARGAELLVYTDRVNLMRYVADLRATIPAARREVAALRASAALAPDAEAATQTRAIAVSLDEALDKQRQLQDDAQSVIYAMIDVALGTNRNESHATVIASERLAGTIDPLAHLDDVRDASGPRASTEVSSHVPGGYDAYRASTPANARDVRSYLQWQRRRDRIGDAESRAAVAAETLASRCEPSSSP